ncbi:MAG TPA: tetratricopeptide repeat protein, partial [Vicinamibacterales bacterium]|nr:tetratricopeptide repeat protein [Vicinamibacterales bacterium]
KSIEYMQDVVGTQPSKWCAGCHDHAMFFNGRFDTPVKEQINTPEAQAGLGCMSCHAITKVGSTMGQGDFTVEYPPLHDLAASENKVLSKIHDTLLYLDPKPHRDAFLKPFHTDQTAEFCSSCHKVHQDKPVNSYRWFRGFNDYDNWQASGVSGQGARSFYYPPKPQKCADCHMAEVPSKDPAARDGKVRSHRFLAANTAIPFVNGDHEQLRLTQEFLRDKQITVDIFALVKGAEAKAERGPSRGGEPQIASTFAVGEESMNFGATGSASSAPGQVFAPIETAGTVRPGESVRVDVVVRTRKVGHFFPGGTVDAFDVWVELEATDSSGRVIMHSGAVENGGPVDPGAHVYRSLMLDAAGNPINKRNAWMARSVAYVRLIPPGAADTVHYRLQVPADVTGQIRLRAKVNYRKFSWWNTQWAYAGVRDPSHVGFPLAPSHDSGRWLFTGDTSTVSGALKSIPNLPITVMAEDEATIRVAGSRDAAAVPPPALKKDRERWNDYGIGLLLQGDLRAAKDAFTTVTQIEPGYADGWVNVARIHVLEGDVLAAETMLRKALQIDPKLAKTHFFLGVSLKEQGRYEDALTHLETAAAQYPRDRVVLNQIGRVMFLQRRFADSIAMLKRVLGVDAEDLQAHYTLMLAYQGLGDAANAARERKLYERFKADEASQTVTGPYRQLHPDDNNERQSVHEHGKPVPPAPVGPVAQGFSPARKGKQ